MIEVLTSGAVNTVQDFGRERGRAWGVGRAGAMDRLSLAMANILAGAAIDAPAIEIGIFPFAVRFLDDLRFAVAGASDRVDIDGARLPATWTGVARAGQTLTFAPPAEGVFAYLALAGGVTAPQVLGSASTDLKGRFGGLGGAPLKSGDRLSAGRAREGGATTAGFGPGRALVPVRLPVDEQGCRLVRVMEAAEWPGFDRDSQARFEAAPFEVTRAVNRQGYGLAGPPLRLALPVELHSHPIAPGVVQVPPSGQAVIQMAEANTCGGYPKIATVIATDLGALAQVRSGGRLRFRRVDRAQALAASQGQSLLLKRLARAVADRALFLLP